MDWQAACRRRDHQANIVAALRRRRRTRVSCYGCRAVLMKPQTFARRPERRFARPSKQRTPFPLGARRAKVSPSRRVAVALCKKAWQRSATACPAPRRRPGAPSRGRRIAQAGLSAPQPGWGLPLVKAWINRSKAACANACMLSIRSLRPVSSVITCSLGPTTAIHACPAGSP
jgi:hypothetical protein